MGSLEVTRRSFVGGAVAAVALGSSARAWQLTVNNEKRPARLFWGDLHNHNAVGYAKGSLERSIELAREHLDFFAFTGHAHWHDMPKMPGDRHLKWVRGFEVHSKHWSKTRQLIREANDANFVALLGYEWHSSMFGDYCVIFPDDQKKLFLPDHVEKLLDFAESQQALAIPHHVAYKQGWRGANFDHFRSKTAPVVEVFSEHGCTESIRAPGAMLRHSMGGRSSANTIVRQLKKGSRFGFVASTDSHRGYPGAYGEGIVGVWAEELTRESLFEAVRARRTYAVTGDRIELEFSINGRPMGSELAATTDRQIDIRVEAQDAIAVIELVRNGRVIERHFPDDHHSGPPKLPGRAKCRIQYGWGPWADLNLSRICHWDMQIKLDGGRFLRAIPCFQSAPFDENARDKLIVINENEIRIQSHTTREKCFAEDPTKAVICDLQGGPDAVLSVHLRKPIEQTVHARLSDLVEDNIVTFTGGFTSESYIIERLVSPSEFAATIQWHDHRHVADESDWYYVRVTQHNGHLAWSSPIWIG